MTALLFASEIDGRFGRYRPDLTKIISPDGVKDFSNPLLFDCHNIEPNSIDELHTLLRELETQSKACLIRGSMIAEGPRQQRLLNKTVTSVPQGLSWLMIDVDKLPVPDTPETVDEYLDFIVEQLPAEFQDVTCYYQWSSSAFIRKPVETLSCHLFFWLASPRSCHNLHQRIVHPQGDWHGGIIDAAPFTPNQIHYTSGPIFRGGMADPLKGCRSGVRLGTSDQVELAPWVAPRRERSGTSGTATPVEIDGLVEAIGQDGHIHSHVRGLFYHYVSGTPYLLRNPDELVARVWQSIETAIASRDDKERSRYSERYVRRMYDTAAAKLDSR